MRLRVATWNINSVRLRVEQVARFVSDQRIDILCLQETKCHDGEFPVAAFAAMGLPHLALRGQKGWHGVAIASRFPVEPAPVLDLCREGQARNVGVVIGGVEIQTVYVPAGGDVPDRQENPKFDHKLDFIDRLSRKMAERDRSARLLLTGDFNVAPGEYDVWSHRQMLKIVSHTPVEIEALAALKASQDFIDLPRSAIPEPAKLFTWWSYRSLDFRTSNRGLRLDHLWASPGLNTVIEKDRLETGGGANVQVYDETRAWARPSDHAPVSVDLRVDL
jgi:exodeoxyribonuclease-3